METASAIAPSKPMPAAAARPHALMDDLPPWLERPAAMPMAPAAQPLLRQPPRRLDTLAHRAAAGEAVHWGVVGLTLFTALSVLLGAFGGDEAKPRELLPIIMTVTAP